MTDQLGISTHLPFLLPKVQSSCHPPCWPKCSRFLFSSRRWYDFSSKPFWVFCRFPSTLSPFFQAAVSVLGSNSWEWQRTLHIKVCQAIECLCSCTMSSLDLIYMLPPEQQDQIINGPALAPPDGVTPNFQDPPNQSIIAEVITPILVAIVAILVLLRFCSKVVVQRSVHIEDGKYSPFGSKLRMQG